MFFPAITNAAFLLTSERCQLTFLDVSNPNTASAFLQIFDSASPSSITLGTTPPLFSIPIPKGASGTDVGQKALTFARSVQFLNGICVAATTAPTGSSALGSAVGVNISTITG